MNVFLKTTILFFVLFGMYNTSYSEELYVVDSSCIATFTLIFNDDGTSVFVQSNKDLSHVELYFCDGTFFKFDNLNIGHSGTFSLDGKQISSASAKAGCSSDSSSRQCKNPTATPTATNTPQPTATNTEVPTATETPVPTATNTKVPTSTPTSVPTVTNTPVPTATSTVRPTSTPTSVPTVTSTPKPTNTPTVTPTPTCPQNDCKEVRTRKIKKEFLSSLRYFKTAIKKNEKDLVRCGGDLRLVDKVRLVESLYKEAVTLLVTTVTDTVRVCKDCHMEGYREIIGRIKLDVRTISKLKSVVAHGALTACCKKFNTCGGGGPNFSRKNYDNAFKSLTKLPKTICDK